MELRYQDQNLITSYIQIYLKEYYGLTVHKIVKRNRIDSDEYEITASDPIRVTGYLNAQTYSSIALFMERNYPNERFPGLWIQENSRWTYSTEVYNQFEVVTTSSDELHILKKDIVIPPSEEEKIIRVIISNMENLSYDSDTISIPRRVLSYLFGEVVSSLSTPEEVLRVKKYLKDISFDSYYTAPDSTILDDIRYISSQITSYIGNGFTYIYDDKFKEIIWQLQDLYIRGHQDEMPEQFIDFKATGYVDPWTEHILKGGTEDEYTTS